MPPEALVNEPVAVFLTIMAVLLISPLLSERIRLPGIVGLILGGMLVGPNGLNLLATGRTIELLSTVGLIYLMFSAGLEIDLNQFGRVRNKALVFGALTFSIPLLSGLGIGRLLDLGLVASILLGSVYASHTLVAFPILSRLGVVRNEAISATIGATVFTDVCALLVLAIVAGSHNGDVSPLFFVRLFALMIGYTVLVLVGLPRLGKLFFRRFTGRSVEFQFVLVVLFIAALLAEWIGMHAIVGAFLAGLAVNSTLPPRSRVIGQVLFVGESFFIPLFLMYIGMVLNPVAIVSNMQTLLTGLLLTAAVYITKFAAAWLTARIYHYSNDEMFTMWGLSQAQAAATLATILVGSEIGLFPDSVFNGAILMILFTCITSPLIAERFGKRLHIEAEPADIKPLFSRVLVPIANPATQEYLITLASILVRTGDGVLLPLNVAQETDGRITGLKHQQELLGAEVLQDPETTITPVRRIDTSIARGIVRAAIENDATMIVMGWRGKPTFRQSIFGTVLDEVIWNTEIPVLVGRLNKPINSLRRIVLVVPPNSMSVLHTDKIATLVMSIARAVNVHLSIRASTQYMGRLQQHLGESNAERTVDLVPLGDDLIQEIGATSTPHDLIIVTTAGSQRRFRSSLGHIPEQLAATTESSMVVIHLV
jgi:Kef-type K+ transport system membrane component KefB/nucleotide-binding universal stress UspA family protein